jgi:toluene monooxygenase system ferredoxin subunit
MAFQRICTLDDLWEGEMTEFDLDGQPVLLVWPLKGEIQAFQGICPHQEIPLAEGKFDGRVVTCRAHLWTFDGGTGNGINPGNCKLARYQVRVEGDEVHVDCEGVQPSYANA